SMMEVTHMHLPMFALVLLLLTHLLIFSPMKAAAKVAFILAAFGSALLSEAAGWMTRFWHPGFAWLKVVMFVTLQAMLAYLIGALAIVLARGRGRGARGRAREGYTPSPRAAHPTGRPPRSGRSRTE